MTAPAIGVDVGGTKIAAGVVAADGRILARTRRDTPARHPDEVRDAITDAVRELRTEHDVTAIGVAAASYFLIREPRENQLLEPALVASLLVANLVPDIALIVLIGRRVARRRATRSPVGGEGELHVRLVALFSVVAAVPMLLVTIAASLLFQYGVQFWYSDRARGV